MPGGRPLGAGGRMHAATPMGRAARTGPASAERGLQPTAAEGSRVEPSGLDATFGQRHPVNLEEPGDWGSLLLSVLGDADRDIGFCPAWDGAHGTSERLPTESDVAEVDVGGLTLDRIVGLIEVDFGARLVRLVFIDYYGRDEIRERVSEPDFWERAAQMAWPLRDREPGRLG